jgi:hypothetical protein
VKTVDPDVRVSIPASILIGFTSMETPQDTVVREGRQRPATFHDVFFGVMLVPGWILLLMARLYAKYMVAEQSGEALPQ